MDPVQGVERLLHFTETAALLDDGRDERCQMKSVDWERVHVIETSTPSAPGSETLVVRLQSVGRHRL